MARLRGLLTEHLKFGGDTLMEYVTKLASRIINTCEIPNLLDMVLLLQFIKVVTSKPLDKPVLYRRITVGSNLGRVVEQYI